MDAAHEQTRLQTLEIKSVSKDRRLNDDEAHEWRGIRAVPLWATILLPLSIFFLFWTNLVSFKYGFEAQVYKNSSSTFRHIHCVQWYYVYIRLLFQLLSAKFFNSFFFFFFLLCLVVLAASAILWQFRAFSGDLVDGRVLRLKSAVIRPTYIYRHFCLFSWRYINGAHA